VRVPRFLLHFLWSRCFSVTLKRPPDETIGGYDNPYMLRWWVGGKKRKWFNLYIHEFRRSDDDRACHDHRAHNISVILQTGYWEYVRRNFSDIGQIFIRDEGDIVFRRAQTPHRVMLYSDQSTDLWEMSALTLFIKGPDFREWGFHCPKGFIPRQKFVDPGEPGKVGKGCDQ
jgi:hypothetical protein